MLLFIVTVQVLVVPEQAPEDRFRVEDEGANGERGVWLWQRFRRVVYAFASGMRV